MTWIFILASIFKRFLCAMFCTAVMMDFCTEFYNVELAIKKILNRSKSQFVVVLFQFIAYDTF